jgi:drug/metabolite transporter (DMT)-like permease
MHLILRAHLALFIVNLIYGLNYTIAKDLTPEFIGPFGFVLMRITGMILLIWTLGLIYPEKVDKKDFKILFFCSLTGVVINQGLFFLGLSLTSPINASIIMIVNPILVVVFAAWILRERITQWKISGIFLGLTGALLLILVKKTTDAQSNIWGDICIFFNAVSYAVFLVMVKPLMQKYNAITVMKWVFLMGLPFMIPFGWNEFISIEWNLFTSNMIWAVVFVIVATTFLAYLLNTYALKRISPSVVSAYIYLQPVIATLVAVSFGKDELTWLKWMAAGLIFTGVWMVSKRSDFG